jgi:hypothetical protein
MEWVDRGTVRVSSNSLCSMKTLKYVKRMMYARTVRHVKKDEVKACAWPAFVWFMLVVVSNEYRNDDLWKLLPLTWRPSWINETGELPSFQNMPLTNPVPCFIEVTNSI